jgi:hypothetical protein
MSSPTFLSNENMKLLWDVLIENEVFQNKSKDFLININYMVNQNIQPFYESEKNKVSNLMELNKKFISFLLHLWTNKSPTSRRLISHKDNGYQAIEIAEDVNHSQKIVSKDSYVKSESKLVTSEEIQTHRMDQFEKDLSLKEMEFKKSMSLPVPPTPVFQDKMDEPISELELEIKKTIAQRNYDIEVIQNNIHSVKTDPTWLTSQETSVKKEKFNYNDVKGEIPGTKGEIPGTKGEIPGIKYIKIENKDLGNNIVEKEIIQLFPPSKKQISWADETLGSDLLERSDQRSLQSVPLDSDQRSLYSDKSLDLFKKLKIIPQSNNSNEQIFTERMENMENKLAKIEKMLELLVNK